ncbi:hypothetical protein ACFQH2_00405 [Natronoarchaeum sp. GCM10025703]|uniref:hypothetical protein n=1 Tax=unclassified Natronoarchaeum TaxID=2620183 RepID=UPI00361CD82C
MSNDDPEPSGGNNEETGPNQRSNLTRRRLVASGAATWATIGLAGCNYITDPGPEDDAGGDGGDDGDDGGNETPSENTTVSNETTTTENGGENGGEEEGQSCASIGRFAAGTDIAMNVDVFDQVSGDHLGAGELESVTVEFPDADFDPINLDWSGPHEKFRPEEWGGKLSTDDDVSSGTYRYEIVVEGESIDGTERITDQLTIV